MSKLKHFLLAIMPVTVFCVIVQFTLTDPEFMREIYFFIFWLGLLIIGPTFPIILILIPILLIMFWKWLRDGDSISEWFILLNKCYRVLIELLMPFVLSFFCMTYFTPSFSTQHLFTYNTFSVTYYALSLFLMGIGTISRHLFIKQIALITWIVFMMYHLMFALDGHLTVSLSIYLLLVILSYFVELYLVVNYPTLSTIKSVSTGNHDQTLTNGD